MAQMLELSNWDFKIIMIKRFFKTKEKINNLHEQMGNFNTEINSIQKSPMENLKMKKT